jgi:Tfp pilus assembly protein PilN
MKNLDFLPEIYKQRDALRRARVWWGAVVVIFGTAIGLMAGVQFWLRHDIRRQLDQLQPQFAAAQTQVRELSSLNAQIAKAGRSAGLFTFLEDPWPRTQILAELVRPLPKSVQLTRIQIGEEEVLRASPQAGAPRRRGPRQEEEEGPKLSPVEQDLAQLRADAQQRQAFVDLEGQTQDVAELHAYVAQVGGSPLFTSAQIMSLEVAPGDKQPAQNNFRLRAIVRPGYAASSGAPASQSKPQQVTGAGPGGAAPRMARGGSER